MSDLAPLDELFSLSKQLALCRRLTLASEGLRADDQIVSGPGTRRLADRMREKNIYGLEVAHPSELAWFSVVLEMTEGSEEEPIRSLDNLGVQITWLLPTRNKEKDFVVQGNLVTMIEKISPPAAPEAVEEEAADEPRFLEALEVFSIEEIATGAVVGIDQPAVLSAMSDLGPDTRLLVARRAGQIIHQQIVEDPRICKDIHSGAVMENLNQKPADVSGWRTHEFYIDPKGCLGSECSRCFRVCPESAIHLRGEGENSFCEIDPLACKGCFICWVECVKKASNCILVDGRVFDADLWARHFGE